MSRIVLVVDDVNFNRRILCHSIAGKLENITLLEAENGEEALEVLARNYVSVVILDIMMPGKSGLEVLEEIKSNDSLRDIPVIIYSAMEEIEYVEKALSLGALDYMTKPLTIEQIEITMPLKVKNALEYFEQKAQLTRFYENNKEEIELAEVLQKSMMIEYVNYDEVEVWGRYIPCGEIGGDIYLCRPWDQKIWIMIADVSGHGIAAAMISTMLNVLFDGVLRYCQTPGELLEKMNERLLEVFKDTPYALVSAFVACLDGDSLQYANAGHPYPLIDRPAKAEVGELVAHGLLLGIGKNAHYETLQCEFGIDDSLLFYTDGLFDSGGIGGFAKWSLVRQYYTTYKTDFYHNTSEALDQMVQFFSRQQRDRFWDDAAVMLVRKNR